jgi:hypothetical protein
MLENPDAVSAERAHWKATFILDGKTRNTFSDFIIERTKQVVECKPTRMHDTVFVQMKATATKALAEPRGYTYVLVDPGVVPYEVLAALVKDGSITLTERTQERMSKWLEKHRPKS